MNDLIKDKVGTATSSVTEKIVREALGQVMDPEIRMLSVIDLGIIPEIIVDEDNASITIYMTPTFSGCPAIHIMQDMIKTKVRETLPDYVVDVKVDFERQWSSNLITDKGREALKNFELAPPKKYEGELDLETLKDAACPRCGGHNTTMQSPFGPTLCRSIHYCFDCKQTFQQFKPI